MGHPRIATDDVSEADVQAMFDDYWAPLVTRDDGELDAEQVKKELYDYKVMMDNVSELYIDITGGQLSKPNYMPHVIREFHEDAITEAQGLCRECGETIEEA
jgi:hypothetical protein